MDKLYLCGVEPRMPGLTEFGYYTHNRAVHSGTAQELRLDIRRHYGWPLENLEGTTDHVFKAVLLDASSKLTHRDVGRE